MKPEDIYARIKQLCDDRNINLNELKDGADLSTNVYQWKSTEKRGNAKIPTIKSLIRVCDYLDISLSYFFATNEKDRLLVEQMELYKYIVMMDEDQVAALTATAKAILGFPD